MGNEENFNLTKKIVQRIVNLRFEVAWETYRETVGMEFEDDESKRQVKAIYREGFIAGALAATAENTMR